MGCDYDWRSEPAYIARQKRNNEARDLGNRLAHVRGEMLQVQELLLIGEIFTSEMRLRSRLHGGIYVSDDELARLRAIVERVHA